jgi:hypothetical protein
MCSLPDSNNEQPVADASLSLSVAAPTPDLARVADARPIGPHASGRDSLRARAVPYRPLHRTPPPTGRRSPVKRDAEHPRGRLRRAHARRS